MLVTTHTFPDDGQTPNNPRLPMILMRQSGAENSDDPATWFEERFCANGWGATWRWGVYDYHHFHTTNHEVLGVSRGTATLLFGGAQGAVVDVGVGDVVILPAGTGHKCLKASKDFKVVGAYPGGKEPDLIRSGEIETSDVRKRIAQVPIPARDPISGTEAGLLD